MKSLTNNASFGALNIALSDELKDSQNYLRILATSPDFVTKMQVAFGNSFDLQKVEELAASWVRGDFGSFPAIEIRDAAEINGAKGAFAAATNTIYLSREFVRENEGNGDAIASVLLEEYAHYIDSQINAIDSAGDEGEIFAALAQSKVLSESELAVLKGEDDSAIVLLDGEEVRIEQATDSNSSSSSDCGDPSTKQAPVYSFYINGVRTSTGEYYNRDLPEIQNFLNAAGYSSSLSIENQTSNQSGVDNQLLKKISDIADTLPSLPIPQVSGVKSLGAAAKFLQGLGGGDLTIQSIIQGLTPFSDFEGQQYVNNLVDKILKIEEDNKKKAQEDCCDTPRPKYFIIAHSQGNFFAEDIARRLPLEIQERTKILSISPFTNYGTTPQGIVPSNLELFGVNIPKIVRTGSLGSEGVFYISDAGQGSSNAPVEVQHLVRRDDISNITTNSLPIPGIAAPNPSSIKEWPGGNSITKPVEALGNFTDSHALQNYINTDPQIPEINADGTSKLNPDGTPKLKIRTPEEQEAVQESFNAAKQKVQELLDFDSGVYPEKKKGRIELANTSVKEGNAGIENTAVFTVTRSGDTSKSEILAVEYGSNKDTAKAGKDYQPGQNTVTFQPGESNLTITVPIIGNRRIQPDRTFTVTLKKPDTQNNTTPDAQNSAKDEDCPAVGKGTIIDDDKGTRGDTYNDPRLVTFDKQYHDFQAAGEFTLIESTTGDLKIQVRQQPVGNNPRSNVSDNTAVASILGGKRIGIYKDQGLLIDGQPTQIANEDSLAIGDGRIYLEGNIYTIVYPTGDQLVAKVVGNTRVNVNVYLTDEREGKVKGLLGNFNKNPKDDLAKRDGTVLSEPVSQQQLYGEYADSWRITQSESLFDYNSGENTNTFTLRNYPRQKVKIADLNPADIRRAEQVIGDRISNPIVREAAIIDYILTGFDESIIEEAIASLTPESVLAIAIPTQAVDDFAATTVNTPIRIDVTSNDDRTIGVPIAIANFDQTSTAGSIIRIDDNNTPDNKTDDQLIYTPTANFTGNDTFNYTVTDGTQTSTAKVTVNIAAFNLSNLNGSNGFTLNGINPGNFAGVSVNTLGDFNGDGFHDFIIGAFGADPNNNNAAGETYVVFGKKGGFPASIDLPKLDGSNGFILDGIDANGFSGGTVSSAGDINGDGLDDLIIGAFGATANGQNNAGKSYVMFGTKAVLPARINLSDLNGNNGFVIQGVNEFDYLGLAASGVGDINADGIDDLLVSSPGPLNGNTSKSYIIYGRKDGFPSLLNSTDINGTNGFVIDDIDGKSGTSVSAAGDINGDRISDLIINAEENDSNSYVIFGSPTAFPANFNLSELNGSNGFLLDTGNEKSGTTVSKAGDINGDGIDDLIIALSSTNSITAKSYVLFGTNQIFTPRINPSEFNGSNGFSIINGIDGNSISSVSAAGDVNGDGLDDLIVGVSQASPDGKSAAGKTYVLFGSQGAFPVTFNLSKINGVNGFVLNGSNEDDLSGTSVSAAGDVNGDSFDDLIIGSPGSLFKNASGQSQVVFGSTLFGASYDTNNLGKLLFNPAFYLSQNPDVQAAVANGQFRNALEHFVKFGLAEGRNPSSLFATDYLINNPDVATAVGNGQFRSGFEHFINYGFTEVRNPSSQLASLKALELFYRSENTDLVQAILQGNLSSGLAHLVVFGLTEGRPVLPHFNALSESFDSDFY